MKGLSNRYSIPLVPSELGDAKGPSRQTGSDGARNPRRLHLPLLFFLSALLLLTACSAQLLPQGAEPATIASGIAPSGDRFLLIGTLEHGIFRSVDDGDWTEVEGMGAGRTVFEPGPMVFDIAIAPDGMTTFAATNTGLFRSTDSGQSWSSVVDAGDHTFDFDVAWTVSIPPDFAATRLVVIKASGRQFGTSPFFSTDSGDTWSQFLHGTPGSVQALTGLRIGSANGRVHSRATGESVELRPEAQDIQPHTTFTYATYSPGFDDAGLFFAGRASNPSISIHRLDAGERQFADTGLYSRLRFWCYQAIPNTPASPNYDPADCRHKDAAFLSPGFTSDGIGFVNSEVLFRTTDTGLTWQPVDLPLLDVEPVRSIAFSPDFAESQLVHAVTQWRLLKSNDGGVTWRPDPGLVSLPANPTATPRPTQAPPLTPFPSIGPPTPTPNSLDKVDQP